MNCGSVHQLPALEFMDFLAFHASDAALTDRMTIGRKENFSVCGNTQISENEIKTISN